MNLLDFRHRQTRITLLAYPFLALLMGAGIAQAQTNVPGDVAIQGVLDVHGNKFNLGSWSDQSGNLGVSATYAEDALYVATLTLTANRQVSNWLWQEMAPTGTGKVLQMSLSSNNSLTLYDKATSQSAAIILDPVGGNTSFSGSVSFNGTKNLMPAQDLSGGANSVLTLGLADARYVTSNSGTNLSIGVGAYSAGYGALAVGNQANATSGISTAIGTNAQATGYGTTALGPSSVASSQYSMAIGEETVSTGGYSAALGNRAQATGSYSSAFGVYAAAVGDYSTALGEQSIANGYRSTAVGQYAFAQGDYTTVVGEYIIVSGPSAAAFGFGSIASGSQSISLGITAGASGTAASAVGYNSAAQGNYSSTLGSFSRASGAFSTALASSSVASGDYSTAGGNTTAGGYYQFAIGRNSIPNGDPHNWVQTDDLFTVGNGTSATATSNAFSVKKNGDTQVAGNLTVVKALIVLPQGDLQMGEFTAQPSPSPTP